MKGFSIYINEDWSQKKEDYVNNMADIGFTGVFISLHIPENNVSMYTQRLKPLLKVIKERKLKLMADISGNAITQIGLSLDSPQDIVDSGFTGLRIDDGISNNTIAKLSHYLTVGLNASTLTETDYKQLIQNKANFNNIEAWHNYYPRPNTGLDKTWFYDKNTWLKNKCFKIIAFVPGEENLRLPLYETLPTLEAHRYESPFISALSLMQNYMIDEVYIGDPGISNKTYKQFAEYLKNRALLLHATSINQKWDTYIYKYHKNRLDVSQDVIRSEQSRVVNKYEEICPENTVPRKKGSVTIDNNQYNRYKGELQIVKHELLLDEKVNVIGQIIYEDLPMLNFIQSGITFKITKIREGT